MRHTTKATKLSAVHRLYEVCTEIVDGMRKSLVAAGKTADEARIAEMRIPVLMKGTDMRVTIEAGPSVLARNTIESAQMKATCEPPVDNAGDAIREAMLLLAQYAGELHVANTVPDATTMNTHWRDDDARRIYGRVARCLKRLDMMQGTPS